MDNKKLIAIILIVGIIVLLFLIFFPSPVDSPPVSPVSPLQAQVVDEGFNNLDGEGEIKWYDGFFTWNPTAQATSYPFITGTLVVHWEDLDTGLMPVSVPYTTTELIVELELRGDESYTQTVRSDLTGQTQPGQGVFDSLIWVWIDVAPGQYDEYIKAYWQIGKNRIYIHLVEDGQIIEPSVGFKLYREDLLIPELIYLPVVMRRAQ